MKHLPVKPTVDIAALDALDCFMNYLLARCISLILYFYICLRTILYSSSI